jgi:hypothetical protein
MQLSEMRDFTGGLNLNAEQFRLGENESPDLLNVDIDRRGGFQLRRGVQRVNATATAWGEFGSSIGFDSPHGSYLVGYTGRRVASSTGGNFTWVDNANWAAETELAPSRFAVMRDELYMTTGTLKLRNHVWTGTGSASALTASTTGQWQETFAASGNHQPQALCIASHGGYMWVGHVDEGVDGRHPNRVRWSHPNQPRRWRSLDYVDVDIGKDNDSITALVPFTDHLLVFKKHSMYAIYGYDADTFQVVTLSNNVGAASQEAVVSTPSGVFFWHDLDGLWVYGGDGAPTYAFDKLREAIRALDIPRAYSAKTHVGWVQDRVWVSVPWGAATTRSMTFVLDPLLGAWTRYDLALSGFSTALGGRAFAGNVGQNRMVELEVESAVTDLFNATQVHIDSYYRTRWVDDGGTIVPKRWRRPEFVIHGGSVEALKVDVFIDWNPADPRRVFFLQGASTGTNATWNVTDWDEAAWGFEGEYDVLVRGGSIGLARAVSLKIHGPVQNADWGVDSMTLKHVPKKVRS